MSIVLLFLRTICLNIDIFLVFSSTKSSFRQFVCSVQDSDFIRGTKFVSLRVGYLPPSKVVSMEILIETMNKVVRKNCEVEHQEMPRLKAQAKLSGVIGQHYR